MVNSRTILVSVAMLAAVGLVHLIGATLPAQAQGAIQMGLDMNTAGTPPARLGP